MAAKRDFDKAAATWDDEPRRTKLASDVARAIINELHPTREMDVLDFGCGTGLLTLLLQPHVRSITGVDGSSRMLGVLEAKLHERGLVNVRTAFCDPERGERPRGNYHLIVSNMTLHHIEDPEALFRLLHDLLMPGGTLCVADLDKEDGTFHEDSTGVFHFGFHRPDLAGQLYRSGFTDIRDSTAAVISKQDADYQVFLICARKP